MQVLAAEGEEVRRLAVSRNGRYLAALPPSGECRVWDLRDPDRGPAVWASHGGLDALFLFKNVLAVNSCLGWAWHDLAAGTTAKTEYGFLLQPCPSALDPARGVLKAYHLARTACPDGVHEVHTARATRGGPGELVAANRVAEYVFLGPFAPGGGRYLGFESRRGRDRHALYDAATDRAAVRFECRPDVRWWHTTPTRQRWQFSPDGGRVYAFGSAYHPEYGREAARLFAFDGAAGGPPVAEMLLPLGADPQCLAVHPGGRLLATAERGRLVTLRDAESLEFVRNYDFATPKLTAVAFTPDGPRCAVGDSRGKVLLFDVDE